MVKCGKFNEVDMLLNNFSKDDRFMVLRKVVVSGVYWLVRFDVKGCGMVGVLFVLC